MSALADSIRSQIGVQMDRRRARSQAGFRALEGDRGRLRELRREREAVEATRAVDASEEVKKAASEGDWGRALAERAYSDIAPHPDAEVPPEAVLARAEAMLLETFRKAEGRAPTPSDDRFWRAYGDVLRSVAEEQRRQHPGGGSA